MRRLLMALCFVASVVAVVAAAGCGEGTPPSYSGPTNRAAEKDKQ
jgi:hypothetical protein